MENNYKFSLDTNDEQLVEIFNNWKNDAVNFHDEILTSQKLSESYYLGDQTDKQEIPKYNSDTVENRIFETVETIVPIVTSNAHHFIVLPGSENEISLSKAQKLTKVLERKYEELEMQEKLEQITRHLLLFRFGVAKWCWDEVKDDVDVKVVDPRLILIPKMRLNPHELPYKMEIQEYTREEMEEYFPKADLDELIYSKSSEGGIESNTKCYRVYECWTPEMVAWFSNGKVLDKKANPYWDFEGDEKKFIDKKSKKIKISKQLVFRNHLDRPTDPYVFFTTYKVGDAPIADISLVEVGIPLQDDINTQKRQIINNLRRMGNGQVYVDSDAMSQEEADNITDEVGLTIRGEGVASQNKVRREAGVPLSSSHFNNLTHSEQMFDNIMGVHGATRGASGNKTLGQDLIARQQDYSRIDLITRVLNRGVRRIANGLVQLMRMYYTEAKVIKILGEEDAVEFISMNRDDIEDHIEIDVKSGTPLPLDKQSVRTEAVQLWQLGALDPVSLFERLDFTNPEKFAERLLAWKQGQLTQDTNAKIQLAAAQAALAPKPPTTESGGIEANTEQRGIETPQNVMERATAALGGGAASLPKTPKLSGQSQKK